MVGWSDALDLEVLLDDYLELLLVNVWELKLGGQLKRIGSKSGVGGIISKLKSSECICNLIPLFERSP